MVLLTTLSKFMPYLGLATSFLVVIALGLLVLYKLAIKSIEGACDQAVQEIVARKEERPRILVYHVGKGPNAPSVSNFAIKLETYLRMLDLPYEVVVSLKKSSKGKIPFMQLDDKLIEDSHFCVDELEKTFPELADKNLAKLDAEKDGIGRAVVKMVEENTYWACAYYMFLQDGIFRADHLLPYKGWAFHWRSKLLQFLVYLELWGHGIGRHNKDEIWDIAQNDLRAVSAVLGTKNYLLSNEQPTKWDCGVFGLITAILYHMHESPHATLIRTELPNLVEYVERLKKEYWPKPEDWCKADEDWEKAKKEKTAKTPESPKKGAE